MAWTSSHNFRGRSKYVQFPRRLIKEEKLIRSQCHDKQWAVNFIMSGRSPVEVHLQNNDVAISMIIPAGYPFQAITQVKVNDSSYSSLLRIPEIDILEQITGKSCLCCHSLTCQSNWTCGFEINQVIREIFQTLEIRKRIQDRKMAAFIKNRYLIDDIPLQLFL